MSAKWQRVTIDIPKRYGPTERLAIAQEVIDYIRDRTADGVDKRGRKFPGYSKAYVESIDFKNAGKSKGDINLRLSGDMLGALKILSEKPGKITIGYEKGTPENDRADGNIRGTYGQPKPLPGKARDFLGITSSDLKAKVLTNYPVKDPEASKERAQIIVESGEAAQAALESEE